MKTQNQNSVNPDTQLRQMAVKSRFFAQYWGQIVAKETKYPNSPTINTTTVFLINGLSNYFLELKSLSNYTKEDSIEVERIWRASDTRVEAYFKNSYPNTVYDDRELVGRSLIKYWLEECKLNFENRIDPRTIQHITDYLRSKRYAVPFLEYSVEDLVSFGWVQLL
ncbi:hypothetical protein [Flavobacterium psychrophilum]|uniref:hypothetical protein n=1 Tax=Flavobacterium psychrophilum TaxID=96345 RepID=UPI000B7C2969|nr:hypothetical protein [Flavobacterium psychrophilum]SNA84019.1 hypothetical protein FI070_440004 [Flavobacterium psychrophilum]